MDLPFFVLVGAATLLHLLYCFKHRKHPHGLAGLGLAVAGVLCPLAVAGIALVFASAALLLIVV